MGGPQGADTVSRVANGCQPAPESASPQAIGEAVEALRAGKPVILPTDTVYGIGVAVRHTASPDAIYDIKQRDRGKPIAWLVDGVQAIEVYGAEVPGRALALARRHWPGALTIIVKASDAVPPDFRSAAGTIGLRMPRHEVALELIGRVGPIATSSANVSGGDDPRTVDDLDDALVENVAAIVQGGPLGTGVASTVVDCSQGICTVVRQGGVMIDSVFTIPIEYESHDGKSTIKAKVWTCAAFGDGTKPEAQAPRGIVQIVHGMAEHIDRYDDLAHYLVERGFVVCAENHIGHGGSVADDGEYGHMPIKEGKSVLLADVHTLRRIVSGMFPDVPYVIYGHSMGSFITRAYITRHGEGIAACVLSGTGNVPPALSKFGKGIAVVLGALRGETYRSSFIDNMGAGGYGKQIENARTNLDWLSTDDKVVDAYIDDDQCGFMFTVGGYATLLDLTAEVATPACAAQVPKDLPVLFVSGDGDPVGAMGQGVRDAAKLMRDAGVATVDVQIFEGMRHEVHNEVGYERVYDTVASWIETHCS